MLYTYRGIDYVVILDDWIITRIIRESDGLRINPMSNIGQWLVKAASETIDWLQLPIGQQLAQ
jgi:hypothetical protein